jgi:hypothetical protein
MNPSVPSDRHDRVVLEKHRRCESPMNYEDFVTRTDSNQ